jgi:hypothetical protein
MLKALLMRRQQVYWSMWAVLNCGRFCRTPLLTRPHTRLRFAPQAGAPKIADGELMTGLYAVLGVRRADGAILKHAPILEHVS